MKSILQSIALLSAAVLIAGCDSSSGGGSAAVVTPAAPTASTTGTAVKGIIDGATVTATDGAGTQIGSSTVLNGTYSITFETDPAPVNPIVVTVTDGSAICDFRNLDNSGNDCLETDGTFAAFGTSYSIAGTTLRSNIAAGSIGAVSNVSPLSEIAAIEATTPLTSASVTQANLAITGLIEALTGISFAGVDFTTLAPANLAASGAVTDSPQALALAAFGSAILGSQAAGESINDVIARLAALISINPATGNVTATGTNLSTFANAYAVGLRQAAAARPNGLVSAAAATATANATAFALLGTGTVTIAPSAPAGSAAPIDSARAFVSLLSAVVGDVLATTGAQGTGGQTNLSTTEAFASELDAVADLTSGNASIAFRKLDAAVKAAAADLATGGTVTIEASETSAVSFTLTEASGTLTLTDVSSAWPLLAAAGNQVVVTGGGDATGANFNLTGVTITSGNAAGTATVQTVSAGTVSYTLNAADAAVEGSVATETISLSGTVAGADADPSFTISLSVTAEPVDVVAGSTRGTYTASLTFTSTETSNVVLGLAGTVGANAQTVTFTTDSGSIMSTVTRALAAGDDGSTDQVTLTDGTASLALVALTGGNLPTSGTIGTITVGDATIATVTADGFVTYADGSIQILPALLFPEPSSAN